MKAVILCGGLGTRIRDANEQLPKPMLPIGDKPIVWHIMKSYAGFGVNEFVLCLGYKGWVIKEYFLNYRANTCDIRVGLGSGDVEYLTPGDERNWKVTLADTGLNTMTGGRISRIRRYVEGDELFLVTYGDGVSNIDIGKLIAFHRKHGKIATVTAVRPQGRFGELQIDRGVVSEFNEKPQVTAGFVNGGFLVCDAKRIWEYVGTDPQTSFENDALKPLARDRQLVAYEHEGYWQPMDTLREYTLLNDLWSSGRAPWKTWND